MMFHVESGRALVISEPIREDKLALRIERAASLVFSDSVTVGEMTVECQEGASLTFQTTTHIEHSYVACGERCMVLNMSVLNSVSIKGDASCTALIHVRRTTNVYTEGNVQIHLRSLQAAMLAPKTWFQSQCVFCIENQATRVAMPCRHSTWCQGCEPSVIGTKFERQCSVCMSPVTSLYIQ